jgi:hypothetical protein
LSIRPSRETIESLRLTLESLEQSTDPGADPGEVAELKRILLARIADLEMLDALQAQSSVSKTPDGTTAPTHVDQPLVDLPPLEVVAAEEPTKENGIDMPQVDSQPQIAD